jgi:hypothetical protein
VDSLLDSLLREDDPLLDTLNNWSESDDDRKRRVLSRGFNRALGIREKNPSLPRVPDYTGNPEVDEKNLRQWCIDVQAQEAQGVALSRREDVEADGAVTQANKLDYNTTLETFMENFCEPLRPELIKRCAKQLRDAHKNKTCLLPSYVGKPKKGQRHAHNAAVLMKDWPRLRDHIPELPPLKPPRSNTISTGK